MVCVNTYFIDQHLRELDQLERREEAIRDIIYDEMFEEIAEVAFEEMAVAGIIDPDVSHNCKEFLMVCIKKHGYSGIFAEVLPEYELEEKLWAEASKKWSNRLDYY